MERRNLRSEPDPKIKAQFKDTPWAISLFNDPILIPFTNDSRVPKSHTGDSFCAQTLNTPTTISAWQSFHRLPSSSSPSASNQSTETLTVMKLGSALNGHPDICHGGFVSLLLDEVIGSAVEERRPRDKSMMTAFLKVDYKKPVKTPATVLCRAWCERGEGRKMWGRGSVEDGMGGVFAVGEALFLVVEKLGGAKL
ncbi:uncharacterized protein LY89DRAFT_769369 [Mollisia scopiformis]|uniref:Thioesterase domain-containing protein n=1 Tax=Mollisia scopiformis TaxID=149040 RepID=A0A132B2D3_MOLSC|nr:uncharacterized protein LY89DRAFT_769369 [Mollisia scopiformis]KUJ06481.1 hypothetical protein LY89DRAFT_769369 [Mollisia scopiformis]